jgi:hypothetical protein
MLSGHHNHHYSSTNNTSPSVMRLAVSTTLHCLVGCGTGEIIGMLLSMALGMEAIPSLILSLALGLVAGFALGIVPLLRSGFSLVKAAKTVIFSEGLSIVVMEGFEALTVITIPGLLHASIHEPLMWIGMLAALGAGFIAALPVNYYLIRKGMTS